MLVLGLTGTIGAGKDVVSDYIVKEHGFNAFSCGDVIRTIADEEGLEPTRENLQMLGKEHRKKEGEGFLGKKAAEIANRKDSDRLVVNGIRNPEEVQALREELGEDFVLIYIHADEETRFERLKERARTGDPKTLEAFKEQDRKEKEKFRMEETFDMADEYIGNEGSLQELYNKVDETVSKLREEPAQQGS